MSETPRLRRRLPPRFGPSGGLAWGLRMASVMFLITAGVMLQAASAQPAVVAPNISDHSLALDGTVSASVLTAIVVAATSGSRGTRWRIPIGLLLILGGCTGGLIALTWLTDPGPEGGIGMRGPLALVGFGCWGAAGLLLVLAARGRPRVRRPLILATACAVLVGIALIASLVQWRLPGALRAENTVATPTDVPPTAARTSSLDGGLMWSAGQNSLGSQDRYATAGGFLVANHNGVTMLDANSGTRRWDYFRYDVTSLSKPRISADGKRIAVLASQKSPVNILTSRGSTKRLWVFDAESGALLVDRIAPYDEDTKLFGIASGQLVWGTDPTPMQGTPGAIRLTDFDGTQTWTQSLGPYCELREIDQAPQRHILTVQECATPSAPDDSSDGASEDAAPSPTQPETTVPKGYEPDSTMPPRIQLFDAEGRSQWRWEAPTADELHVGAIPDTVRGTLVVQQGEETEAAQSLTGLRLADGGRRWQQGGVQLTANPPPRSTDLLAPGNPAPLEQFHRVLRGTPSEPVLVEGYALESEITLIGLDPATGDRRWTTTLPSRPFGNSGRSLGDLVTTLDDGRLAVATLPYAVATAETSGDEEELPEPDDPEADPGEASTEPDSGATSPAAPSGQGTPEPSDDGSTTEEQQTPGPQAGPLSPQDTVPSAPDSPSEPEADDRTRGDAASDSPPAEEGNNEDKGRAGGADDHAGTDTDRVSDPQIPGESVGGFVVTSVNAGTGEIGTQIAPDLGRTPAPVTTSVVLREVRGGLIADVDLVKASDLTLGIS